APGRHPQPGLRRSRVGLVRLLRSAPGTAGAPVAVVQPALPALVLVFGPGGAWDTRARAPPGSRQRCWRRRLLISAPLRRRALDPALSAYGIPFGFVFTLRPYSLEELPRVADFAAKQGARLLQVHLLAEAGRAAKALAGQELGLEEAAVAWLAVRELQSTHAGRLRIHVDLWDRAVLDTASEQDLEEAEEERAAADER